MEQSSENIIEVVDTYAKSYPYAVKTYDSVNLTYAIPNQNCLWRVSSFETKEPETVKWIASFSEDDVFVDIGANMGLYSIFAAVYAKARVFAFEPESQNYALLNQNIDANKMGARVTAWCCALSDANRIDHLYLSRFSAADSMHQFGAEVDDKLAPRKAAYAQGSFSYELDDLIARGAVPVPDHIKIDVDGFEHLVIAGAKATVNNPAVQSVLIEINPHLDEHKKLIDYMTSMGFQYDSDQVERARRKDGNTKDYAEYIFRR